MKITQRALLVATLCLALLSAGCTGPFNLTRQVHHWNDGVSSERWVREGVFLLLVIVPVYELCTLGDALVFNSIEFWTGDNPINAPGPFSAVLPEGTGQPGELALTASRR